MREEIIMAKQKKIKKHKREKPPKFTAANQIIYFLLFLILVVTGLGFIALMIIRFDIVDERVLAIKYDATLLLMFIPGLLTILAVCILYGDLYQERYRFVQKLKKEKRTGSKIFFISLIVFNILMTTICHFHRTELTMEGVQKYGFVHELKVSYPKEEIVEVQIGIYQMIKSTTFAVDYKLIYKDGTYIHLEQSDFRNIVALAKFDQSLSGVKRTVNDLDKIDKLKRNGNYTEKEWKRVMELFEITEN